MFSDPDISKDFAGVRESELWHLLETSRLVDKVAKQLRVDRRAIPETLERKVEELRKLKNDGEILCKRADHENR